MPRASFFLRLTDSEGSNVEGEAQEHGFEETIEVTSWDWSVADKAKDDAAVGESASSSASSSRSSASSRRGSGQGETGKQSYLPTPLRFSKQTDRSTTRLLQAMVTGEVFQTAKFTLRQELSIGTGDGKVRHDEFLLHLILSEIRVTNYDFNAQSESFGVDLTEDWTFSYRALQFDFVSAAGHHEAGKKGPGLGEEFVLPPGSTTKAPKKPEPTAKELLRRINDMESENEHLRRSAKASDRKSTH